MTERSRNSPFRSARAWPGGRALAVLLGVLALLPGLPAQAGPPAPSQSLEARLGFEGALKVGVPLPLDVSVPPLSSEGPAELIVDAPALGPQAGTVVTSTVVPFHAVAGVGRAFHVPVVVSDLRRPLTIRVMISGREALRRDLTIDPARVGGRVLVVLSDRQAGLEFLRHLSGRVVIAYVVGRTLPRVWQEYAAADLLVVRDLGPAELEAAQREALVTWVRLGGRLLVIPHPGTPVAPFLQAVLPALVGPPRSVSSLAALAARYGGAVPAGPYAVAALEPQPGAEKVDTAGVPVIASAPAGLGRATVWAFDPLESPFPEWSGRLRLWEEVLGPPSYPHIDAEGVAGRFPARTPLDPWVHVAVGGAIFSYIAALFLLHRRWASARGAAGSLAVIAVGIAVFAGLAHGVRARSVTLNQAMFFEQAPGTHLVQVTAVAVVAVPYGGDFRVTARPGLVAGPVGPSGDVRVTLTPRGDVLTGRLSSPGAARAVRALGAASMAASGWVSPDGRILTVDLETEGLRRAELRWRDRVYLLGDLPLGHSTRELRPEQWVRPPEADGEGGLRAWIFGAPGRESAGVIMEQTMPVLVGELERAAPAFTLQDAAAPGQRLTILLVPLVRR